MNKPQLINFCEFDKYAVQSYCAIHNTDSNLNLGDITKVNEKEIADFNMMTWGFPCCLAGSKIKTINGYKDIENIIVGDNVLTHNNLYKKVYETMNRESNHYYNIKYSGNYMLKLTEEHPLYVYRNDTIEWVKVKNLNTSDYLSFNINQKYENDLNLTIEDCWLLGRYCADGCIEKDRSNYITFCIGSNKRLEFMEYLNNIPFTETHKNRNCQTFRIQNNKLLLICNKIGLGAKNKSIPQEIINLPNELLQSFFNGYISGDGFRRKDKNVIMWTTVSETLMLGLSDIVIKLYHKIPTVNIRKDLRKETFNDSYNCQISLEKSRFSHVFQDKLLVKIKAINRINNTVPVYNFSVENDESYTVNNCIVHNCTDISVAGKQKGFIDEDGNKTRSGMYYEGIRILREKKPALSIVENVKALTSKKFKNEFDMVLKDLDEAGYNTYWQILNAKDYGIPQNRERVFLISVRKDLDNGKFVFPKGFNNGLRLKDLLDNEVDEKYYLSEQIQSRFVSKIEGENIVGRLPNGNNTNFSNDMVFGINNNIGTLKATDYKDPKKILCGIDKSYNNPELIENANCITAREDRGISNRKAEGTAIIETNRCIQTGDLNYYNFDTMNRVYSKDGISPTLQTLQGGNRQPKILEDFYSNRDVREYTDYSPTLRSERNGLKVTDNSSFKVRKLTPKECFYLMGFSKKDFNKAKSAGVSDSQLYKQAGNSIVTYVLYEIYKELYKAMPYLFGDIKLSSFFSGIGAFEVALDMLYNYIITGEEQNFIKPQVD